MGRLPRLVFCLCLLSFCGNLSFSHAQTAAQTPWKANISSGAVLEVSTSKDGTPQTKKEGGEEECKLNDTSPQCKKLPKCNYFPQPELECAQVHEGCRNESGLPACSTAKMKQIIDGVAKGDKYFASAEDDEGTGGSVPITKGSDILSELQKAYDDNMVLNQSASTIDPQKRTLSDIWTDFTQNVRSTSERLGVSFNPTPQAQTNNPITSPSTYKNVADMYLESQRLGPSSPALNVLRNFTSGAPLVTPQRGPYTPTPWSTNSFTPSQNTAPTFSNSSPFPWQSSGLVEPSGPPIVSGGGLTDALPAMWQSAKETARAAAEKMAAYLNPPESAFKNPDLAFPIAPETTLNPETNDAIAGEAFNLPPLARTTDELMRSISEDIDPNPFSYDTEAGQQARKNLQNEVDAVNDKVGQLLSGNPSADDILTAKALAEVNKEVAKTLLDTRSSWQGVRDWLGVAKSPQKIAAEIAEAQLQQVAQAEAGAKIDLARNAYVLGPDASKPLGLAALSNGTKVQDDLTTEGPVGVNPDGTSRPLTPVERMEYDQALEKLGGEIMESRKIPPEALKELGDLIKVGAPTKLSPDSNAPDYGKSLPNDQSRESTNVEDVRAENADPTWSLIDEKGEVTGAVNTSKLVDNVDGDTFSDSNLPPLAKTVEELKASLEGPTGGRSLETLQEARQIAREDLRVAQEALVNDRSLIQRATDAFGLTESKQLADVNAAQQRVDALDKLVATARVDNMISDMQARADTLRQTAQEVGAAADATNRAVDIASTPIERLSSGVPKEISTLPPSETIRAEDVSSTEIAGCDGIVCMARETASSAWDSLKAAGGFAPDVNKLGPANVVPTAYLPGLSCGTGNGSGDNCDRRVEGLYETKYENPLGWKNAADHPFAPNGNTPITLDDVAAARAKGYDIPVTVAAQEGREGDAFLIPKVSWRSITDGEMHTEENVRAVVTDTGGAFNAGGCATWGTCADIEYKIDVPTGNFEYVTRADAQGYDRGSNFSTSGTWQKIETPSSADLTQSYPTAPSPWGDSSVQVAGLENSHIVSLGAGGVSPGVLLAEAAPSNMSPFALYGSPTAASPSISVASMDIGTAVYGPGGGPYDVSTSGGYYGLSSDPPSITGGPSPILVAGLRDARGQESSGRSFGGTSYSTGQLPDLFNIGGVTAAPSPFDFDWGTDPFSSASIVGDYAYVPFSNPSMPGVSAIMDGVSLGETVVTDIPGIALGYPSSGEITISQAGIPFARSLDPESIALVGAPSLEPFSSDQLPVIVAQDVSEGAYDSSQDFGSAFYSGPLTSNLPDLFAMEAIPAAPSPFDFDWGAEPFSSATIFGDYSSIPASLNVPGISATMYSVPLYEIPLGDVFPSEVAFSDFAPESIALGSPSALTDIRPSLLQAVAPEQIGMLAPETFKPISGPQTTLDVVTVSDDPIQLPLSQDPEIQQGYRDFAGLSPDDQVKFQDRLASQVGDSEAEEIIQTLKNGEHPPGWAAPPASPPEAAGTKSNPKPDSATKGAPPPSRDFSGGSGGGGGGGGSSGGGGSGGSSASGGGSGSGFLQGGLSLLGSLFQNFKDFFSGGSQDGQGQATQQPTQPSQPAPSVQIVGTIVGNPSTVNLGEKSLLSWSSVGTDAGNATCAIINAQFQVIKRGGQDGNEWSPALTESTRFGLICNVKQASEKLLNETLVRVRGDDTDPPRIFSNSISSQGTVTGSGSSAPSSGTSGSSGGSSGSGGQSGSPAPDDVRTCDPDQSMDSFIICLCEAEPNPAGCTIPPGGL